MSKQDEQSRAAEAEDRGRQEETTPPEEGANESREVDSDLFAELEQAQAKAEEYWDRLVRMSAEMDNVRKRAERDVEQARKFALEKFARELLSVRDSLEMGIASAREEGGADKHVEGMELTLRMLTNTMEKFDIQEMNPEGEPFNPEYHEAMSTQEIEDKPANTVIQVMQKGYLLNERVLRPAMVVVSREPS